MIGTGFCHFDVSLMIILFGLLYVSLIVYIEKKLVANRGKKNI